jgi:hypothetical protein
MVLFSLGFLLVVVEENTLYIIKFLLFLMFRFLEVYGVLVSAKTVCVTIYTVTLKLKNLSTSFWRWNIMDKAQNQ